MTHAAAEYTKNTRDTGPAAVHTHIAQKEKSLRRIKWRHIGTENQITILPIHIKRLIFFYKISSDLHEKYFYKRLYYYYYCYDEYIAYEFFSRIHSYSSIHIRTHNCAAIVVFPIGPGHGSLLYTYKRTRRAKHLLLSYTTTKKTPRTIFHKRKITLLLRRRPFFDCVGLHLMGVYKTHGAYIGIYERRGSLCTSIIYTGR